MRPKGKLFALFAIFAAIGLVTATGAFTTVSAERTATVNTSGDASALLAIEPAEVSGSDTANANTYVSTDGGTVSITLSNSNQGSSGVNLNAKTEFTKLLNVTNQGSQSIKLDVSLNDTASDEPSSDTATETASNYVTVYAVAADGTRKDITSGSMTLSTGDSVFIEIVIDLRGGTTLSPKEDVLDDITFNANAT